MAKLTGSEITKALSDAPGWALREGMLEREWTFSSFREAIAFVNRVADFAEAADHHPDIELHYDRVRLTLISHDAGGITQRDTKMAQTLSLQFPG